MSTTELGFHCEYHTRSRLHGCALLMTACSPTGATSPPCTGRSTACPMCTSWEPPGMHGCSNLGCTARTSTASAIRLEGAYAAPSAPLATGAGEHCGSQLAPVLRVAVWPPRPSLRTNMQAENNMLEDSMLHLPRQSRQQVWWTLCRGHLRQLPVDALWCVSGLGLVR
jgi:hypothetical protein